MRTKNYKTKTNKNQIHLSFYKEQEGTVELYVIAPGVSISFNEIHSSSWTTGEGKVFTDHMLILNFCLDGRCDVSLAGGRYAIVEKNQVCVSTILPTKDFYYPGRKYEGLQIYIDRTRVREEDFLGWMGVEVEQVETLFCGKDGLYLHRMTEDLIDFVKEVWKMKENPEWGMLRYSTVRLMQELMKMPYESEKGTYYTRSQIAIVKEAEAMILQDLSKRITAKEMAEHFGISESSFKLYVKGILGDSYLSYFRKKRMERAAELLESGNGKVIEIANAVGYENQGKFARVFAEMYGVTPMEYRRLSRRESGLM